MSTHTVTVRRLFLQENSLSKTNNAGPKSSQHMLVKETGLLQLVAQCLSQLSHKNVQAMRMSDVSKKHQLVQLPSHLQQCVRCQSLATGRRFMNSGGHLVLMAEKCHHVCMTIISLHLRLPSNCVATNLQLADSVSNRRMRMCRSDLECNDDCRKSVHFTKAETVDMEVPGCVSACEDSKLFGCISGEEDASIVFTSDSEVRETARRPDHISLRCHSLQVCQLGTEGCCAHTVQGEYPRNSLLSCIPLLA